MATVPADPLILCYDGSEDAKHAIERAGSFFSGRDALVLTVWQPTSGLGSFAWSGATASMVNFVELDRAAAEDGGRIAAEGVGIARDAGLEADRGQGHRTCLGDDHRDRWSPSGRDDRHGLSRAHRPALDAVGQRLQRCRPPCPPAHPGHPLPQRRGWREVAPGALARPR